MHLPCPPAFKEPSTSSRPKSMSRSERPNWPPENLTHLHQVLKIKTPSGYGFTHLTIATSWALPHTPAERVPEFLWISDVHIVEPLSPRVPRLRRGCLSFAPFGRPGPASI